MKKRTLGKFIGMPLCAVLLLAACGKNTTETDDGSSKEETQETEDPVQDEKTDDGVPETAEPEDGGAVEEGSDAEDLSSQLFSEYISETEKMISEAADQYYAEDYTPLDEPVKYNVLWLGFTHVTYKELDFQMTDDDREYLEAVALNFEKSVESITDHNLDITVDLHFSEDAVELTQWEGADWLYLAQDTVQPVIDQYTAGKEYDTVLTTVQSSGDENYFRNEAIDYYSDNYIMLGLKTSGLSSAMGYSTFDLGQPREGTYPLEDPEIPSLYATAVAVHEWMHQLEDLKTIMGIEYPDTHAYQGGIDGYQAYTADENDYDFFEFYKLVLTGKLPYTGDGSVKHVGMYPKMWKLAKRKVNCLGAYTIKAADGKGYLTGKLDEPTLDISSDPCIWNIRYAGNKRFILSPKALPDKLVDLGNAWDLEDNTIGLWIYTGYVDAQSWYLILNDDGTASIQTPYESGRVLTLNKGVGATLCSMGADGVQEWIFEPAK